MGWAGLGERDLIDTVPLNMVGVLTLCENGSSSLLRKLNGGCKKAGATMLMLRRVRLLLNTCFHD